MKDDKYGIAMVSNELGPTTERAYARISKDQLKAFNQDVVRAGLRPECVSDLMPITIQLGHWMGRNLLKRIPLDQAIAQIDEVVGASLETLLDECDDTDERVNMVMLEAALRALALCCEPGRVVEAATFIIQTTFQALDSAATQRTVEAS
jgi:hypothetical protein